MLSHLDNLLRVMEVAALEQNLLENRGKAIKEVEGYVGKSRVPPEVGNKVLPRLRAAKADIEANLRANPGKDLKSPDVQKELAQILDRHEVDRVVMTSSAAAGVKISSK